MEEKLIAELNKTNRMLNAILSIVVDKHIRDSDLAKPRPRSVDRMLSDNGLTNTEIATLLGKSPQAVGQVLKAETKAKPNKKQQNIDVPEIS